jgi:hypothetical protein
MQEHLHSIKTLPQLQKLYGRIHHEIEYFYDRFIPQSIRQRRNTNQQIQKDVTLITVCLLGKMLGFTSERTWHAFVQSNLFPDERFPERSRFNRICRHLRWVIKFLRFQFTRRFVPQANFTIMDSLPLPLCHSARSFRVKRLRDYADFGYCAAKKERYYGFKGSFQISDSGFIISYVISKASVHDIRVVEELLEQSPHSIVLGDKGYVGEKLRHSLDQQGIQLLSLKRANSKNPYPMKLTRFIRFRRKQIETLFSGLCDVFHLISLKPNSLIGYELAIDSILFAHSLLVLWVTKEHGHGSKWKNQIFN